MMHDTQEPYIPDALFTYPDKPDEHIVPLNVQTEVVLDEKYPFLDKSFKFKLMSFFIYMGIFFLVFVLSPLRFGLKIEGRKILKKHRKLFKNGVLTASNHVQRWDLLFVLQAVRWRRLYFPVWDELLTGSDRNLIRWSGGIPVPKSIHVIKYFNNAFDELHEKKKWLHVFPEASNWWYYQPIRPFKKGMFTFAYKYALPVIPMAFSYRKPSGYFVLLNRLRKKNFPLVTLRIGEPLLPDMTLSRKEAVLKLRKECHEAVVALAGIQNNPWPAEGD